ncbi:MULTISPECIES: adenylyl-sulfate kinase [Bacteria]
MSETTVRVALDGSRLEGLEILLARLLPQVDGYRLPGDVPEGWPVVPHLVLTEQLRKSAAEVILSDQENTPLAILSISETTTEAAGRTWVSGTLHPLKRPEHGPARTLRLSADSDLSGHTVALFGGVIHPADVLRAVAAAEAGQLDLVAEGSLDSGASARLVSALEECALLRPDTRVFFVPRVELGDVSEDVTREVILARGATEILDFRRVVEEDVRGAVVLFTGLSGAGKSTIARAVAEEIARSTTRRVVLLDGDHVRAELASELGFSPEDRDRNLQRQAWVGARVAEAGGLAICAPIAPFASSRAAMRAKIEPASPCLLVYVSTPLAVAEGRDRKGLYAKARAGLITDFTGIDSPYEIPEDADLSIDTSALSVEQCVGAVVSLLTQRGVIHVE